MKILHVRGFYQMFFKYLVALAGALIFCPVDQCRIAEIMVNKPGGKKFPSTQDWEFYKYVIN